MKQTQGLSQDIQLNLEPTSASSNLRLIAFVQEPRQVKVLGAALLPVGAN